MSFSGRLSPWVLPDCSSPGQTGSVGCTVPPAHGALSPRTSHCSQYKPSATRPIPAALLTHKAVSFKASPRGCLISPSRLEPTSGRRDN